MNSRIEQTLSWILTAAAVAIAAGVINRAFFSSPANALAITSTRPFEYNAAWQKEQPSGIRLGDAAAPLQLIEFADLECPACRVFHQKMLSAARAKFGERLAITFVHFPLSFHRFARQAAQAAECANHQGRFGHFVDVAYAKQDSFGLKPWVAYAKEAMVDDTLRFAACIAGPAIARIDSGVTAGRSLELTGTPTIVLNGWRFPTTPSTEDLISMMDDLMAGRAPRVAEAAKRGSEVRGK